MALRDLIPDWHIGTPYIYMCIYTYVNNKCIYIYTYVSILYIDTHIYIYIWTLWVHCWSAVRCSLTLRPLSTACHKKLFSKPWPAEGAT